MGQRFGFIPLLIRFYLHRVDISIDILNYFTSDIIFATVLRIIPRNVLWK